MTDALKEKHRCVHLEDGSMTKHAVVTFNAESETTSYAYNVELELCVLCSGYFRGHMGALLGKWR